MLKITGGTFKGRSIQTPHGKDTRPTQAKVREAIFNSIQGRIDGARVLDLFAGSGGFGFEALSRHAESVTFIERSPKVCRLITTTAEDLGVSDRVHVICKPIERCLDMLAKDDPFDVVFADPPYASQFTAWVLNELPWQKLLSPEGLFVLEWGKTKSGMEDLPDKVGLLAKSKERDYGESTISYYHVCN